MSKKYIFGISALTAIGVFLFVFGYAAYTDAGFSLDLVDYLPGATSVLGLWADVQILKSAGYSELEILDIASHRIKYISLLFITAGAATLVSAFLLYRHSEKQ